MGTGLLMLLVSLGAIVGGFMLIVEPAGTPLKLSVDMLKETPFTDYLIPGIILMAVIGILGLLSAYMAFQKQRYAGFGAIAMGAALVIWIAAEVFWFGWQSWLQPTFMAAGATEMILGVFLEAGNHEKGKWFGGQDHHNTHAH
jgi:hypothetical protein